MELIQTVASHMSRYVKITGLTGDTYRANKKNIKRSVYKTVTHNRMLDKFGRNTSICYAALSAKADLNAIKPDDCLYVGCGMGCQRYWRGKGLNGEKFNATNFHHTQMRLGHDGHNIETYLENGNAISIHVITGDEIESLVEQGVLNIRLRFAKQYGNTSHFGNVLENEILAEGKNFWAWNSSPAEMKYRDSSFLERA